MYFLQDFYRVFSEINHIEFLSNHFIYYVKLLISKFLFRKCDRWDEHIWDSTFCVKSDKTTLAVELNLF